METSPKVLDNEDILLEYTNGDICEGKAPTRYSARVILQLEDAQVSAQNPLS